MSPEHVEVSLVAVTNEQIFRRLGILLDFLVANTSHLNALGGIMTELTDKVAEVQAALDAFSAREAGEDTDAAAYRELSQSTIAGLQAQIDALNAGEAASIEALETIKAGLEALNQAPPPVEEPPVEEPPVEEPPVEEPPTEPVEEPVNP